MIGWSIGLAVASAALALAGIGFTVAGFISARREATARSTWGDVKDFRAVIVRFMLGNLWRTYTGVGLTAASVMTGAASNIVGALASSGP